MTCVNQVLRKFPKSTIPRIVTYVNMDNILASSVIIVVIRLKVKLQFDISMYPSC